MRIDTDKADRKTINSHKVNMAIVDGRVFIKYAVNMTSPVTKDAGHWFLGSGADHCQCPMFSQLKQTMTAARFDWYDDNVWSCVHSWHRPIDRSINWPLIWIYINLTTNIALCSFVSTYLVVKYFNVSMHVQRLFTVNICLSANFEILNYYN